MGELLRIRATTNFGVYRAGDEIMVAEDPTIRAEIKSRLWELIAIETTTDPTPPAAPEPDPTPEPAQAPPAKRKPVGKTKTSKKKS